MNKVERFEDLGENYFVAVSKEHKFGTDAFLLSDFARILRKDVVAEFGTGCGIISILLYKKYKPKKIYAFDILESATYLAKQSVIKSKLDEKISVLHKDINELGQEFCEKFNKIVCNPPYKALNHGKISESDVDRIARHEVSLTIKQVCAVSKKLLKWQGSLFLCCRVERLLEVLETMRKSLIEPKRLQFCSKDVSKKPWLFLVEGKKGAKPFLEVMPNSFVN